MVTLTQVYTALDAQGARVYPYPIEFTKAATIEIGDSYAVFFDAALVKTVPELKACLAHECGHCAMGATHRVASPWDLIERHENKANRWAFEQFLPYLSLQDAIAQGFIEAWQLAEYFDMPQSFIEEAVQYYTQICLLTLGKAKKELP